MSDTPVTMLSRFRQARAALEAAARPLSAEDMCIQSMPDASPAKWHLAHTSWFYETFVLADAALGDYLPFNPAFSFLFNSDSYNTERFEFARGPNALLHDHESTKLSPQQCRRERRRRSGEREQGGDGRVA